jgi:hypothetical protein
MGEEITLSSSEMTDAALLAFSLVPTLSSAARASSDKPGINLSGSSFMDGFGRTDPGLMYQPDRHDTFFANACLPVIERNTTSGFLLAFRWIHEL